MNWLIGLWWRTRPRCGDRVRYPEDIDTCIRPRGHENWKDNGPQWHADGNGYIWNQTDWKWTGRYGGQGRVLR